MSAQRDSKSKPKSAKRPKLARPKEAVKDLEPKANAEDEVRGGRKAGKEQHDYL